MKPSQRKLERALKKLKAFSTKQKRESGDQARYLTKARLDEILAVQTNSADYIQSIMVKEDIVPQDSLLYKDFSLKLSPEVRKALLER